MIVSNKAFALFMDASEKVCVDLLTNAAKYNKEKLLLTTLEVFIESQRMTAFINKI